MRGRDIRRAVIAEGQLGLASQAVLAMGDLLGKAQIFPEGVGGRRQYPGVISLGNLPLCLEFGSYRAQVVVVEDALSFEGDERDHEGPEYGVRSGHFGLTIRVDVAFAGCPAADLERKPCEGGAA